jgi:hypothetical protein
MAAPPAPVDAALARTGVLPSFTTPSEASRPCPVRPRHGGVRARIAATPLQRRRADRLDPPPNHREGFADRLLARMLKRPAGPLFTYRLNVPRLGLPTLEVDPEFDLSRHVHRITLKAPGRMKQLLDQVGALHQKHLDRARSLWELYLIDGPEGGKVALFGKMHHGMIDGRNFVQVISDWLSLSPDARTVRAMWEGVPQRPGRAARRVPLLGRLRGALGLAAGATSTTASLSRMLLGQALGTAGVGSADTLMLPFIGIPKVLRADRRRSARSPTACCRFLS